MKRDTVDYFAVGIFVLVMIFAFFLLMYFVAGSAGPADHYTVKYRNVSGLKFGTGVFYEGYKVGQIEAIEPTPVQGGMEYVLTVSITRDWKIPVDSVATVMASGLIAAVQIEIDAGTSQQAISPGGEIEGQEQQDLFAVINEAAGEFQTLSRDGIIPVLVNLNKRIDELSAEGISFRREQLGPLVDTFNKRLNEDLIGDAQTLLAKLDHSAQQLNKILGAGNQQHIENFLIHMDDDALNLGGLISRIEMTRVQMGETLAALKHLVADNTKQFGTTVENANLSMQEMRSALQTVNEHLGTIMYDVEGSARQLHEFSQSVRDNPARIIRGTQ
ncbi:MAG: phospholipid/cholesterol/gamma-HCH transport system substrate-binding protein [Gammaproteobacteria bacterium]|jgi:phospholipid/cholesterol/gamma-HCH transport system substrate-binding protein